MSKSPFEADIAAISRISAVPTILQVVSESTGLRFSIIARVTQDRWTLCAVHDKIDFGLKVGDELDVATTLCSEVRDSKVPVVIDHASADPVYCGHRTPKMYGFESYIAVPIFRRDGSYFGNVCALDPLPAKVSEPKTVAMLKLFAELVALQLEDEEQHAKREAALVDEKSTAELREQFIAVLGHDLRNPLAAITTGAAILARKPLDAAGAKVVHRIGASARRISALVDDVLDLARGRLGGGIPMVMDDVYDLDARLQHVVDEIASAHPERTIHFVTEGSGVVRCAPVRIEQLVSNLIANAIEHGVSDEPVEVAIRGGAYALVLTVRNRGTPIPAEAIPRLFQPYARGATSSPRTGLGLGLFIVAEIVKSHGGKVEVTSSIEEGTTFTVTLPRRHG